MEVSKQNGIKLFLESKYLQSYLGIVKVIVIKKWIKGTLTLIDALKKNSPTQSFKDTTSKYNVTSFATFCLHVFTAHFSHAFVKRCKDFKQNKPLAKDRTGEVVKGKGNKTMSLVPFTWTLYL